MEIVTVLEGVLPVLDQHHQQNDAEDQGQTEGPDHHLGPDRGGQSAKILAALLES